MPKRDPVGARRRAAISARRVGIDSRCSCGEARPEALIPGSKPTACAECKRAQNGETSIDAHHFAGRANSPQQATRNKEPDELVLTRPNGRPVGDFRRSWRALITQCGLPGLLVHDLRRSGVRNLVNAGVSEKVAMTISGHKTRSVFDRYHIVDQRDKRNAMARLEADQARQEAAIRPLPKALSLGAPGKLQ